MMAIRSKTQQSRKFRMTIAVALLLIILPASLVSADFEVEAVPRNYQRLLGTNLEARPALKLSTVLALPTVDPETLPDKYDWREFGPEVPVRDQGECAACWAFAFVGVLERLIAATDADSVRFSEQWVLDCNNHGWNCDVGWNPYDMLVGTDACGEIGLVLESTLPYQETELPCACNTPHTTAYSFVYEGSIDERLPLSDKVHAIKQAIMLYGPVWTALHAGNMPFFTYTGGVFSYKPSDGSLDHSAVIEGWDDTQGSEGVWILRNSWGDGWGDKGYMYIEYDSSFVGSYIDVIRYAGASGSIQVTIEPQAAQDAGALWSVDDGRTWLSSDATSLSLVPDNYTISYQDVTGFETPPDDQVTVGAKEAVVRTGIYVASNLGETEGEILDDLSEIPEDTEDEGRCSCQPCTNSATAAFKRYLGDWLFVGSILLTLLALVEKKS